MPWRDLELLASPRAAGVTSSCWPRRAPRAARPIPAHTWKSACEGEGEVQEGEVKENKIKIIFLYFTSLCFTVFYLNRKEGRKEEEEEEEEEEEDRVKSVK